MHTRDHSRPAGGRAPLSRAPRSALAAALASGLLAGLAAGQTAGAGDAARADPSSPAPSLEPGQAERARERQAAWNALLARHDQDGDGVIARVEYGRGISGFVLLDRDRDGEVSADDFGPSYPDRLPELPGVPGLDDGSALAAGQQAPDFELVRAGPPGGTLSLGKLLDGRGLVLVFGSLTDPALRAAAEDLRELASVYAREVNFVLVYVREAHALDSLAPGTFPPRPADDEGGPLTPGLEDPLTLAEREELCLRARQALALPLEAAVDRLDDLTARAYDAWPSRLCLVGPDGRLVFASPRGVLDVAALEVALLKGLTRSGRRPGPAPDSPTVAADRPGPAAPGPASAGVLAALDADGDGALSAAEIEGAPEALRALDLDGDGVLLPSEVHRALTSETEAAATADEGQRGEAPAASPAETGEEQAPRAPATPDPGREPVTDPARGVLSYDSNRDGRLSRIEVPRPWLEPWEGFDRDDDGYLDTAEQAALTAALEERRAGRTGGADRTGDAAPTGEADDSGGR